MLIGYLLFQNGWLTLIDGHLTLTRPPLYLQEPGYEISGHRYLYDETLGWRNIPNWRATTFDRPLTINSKGLRGKDYPYEKPKNTKRILILGDSYAWGYGVADDELFSEVLEARLASLEQEWEVINTGVSGWGTDQQYLFLKDEGLRYGPDIVVLAFFIGNDIDNNVAATQYLLNKPVFVDYRLTLGNVPVPRPGWGVDSATLAKLAMLDGVQLSVAIIKAMAEACTEHHCQLVLMKFGVFLAPELPYALDLELRFVQGVRAAELNVPYLDLDSVFRERSFSALRLTEGNNDGHWNAFGHEQVAIALERFLKEQRLF